MNLSDIRPNMIFRYSSGAWCRHGLAIIQDRGYGLFGTDTYWRDPSMDGVSLEKLAEAEFLGCLDDFRKTDRDECDRYDDCDVIHVPIGGISEQWWVRKDAKPNKQRHLRQLDWKIEDLRSHIKFSERRLAELLEERTLLGEPDRVI
jgi:hypothetical protein